MNSLNIAIIGCGTVGGGVAKILTEINDVVSQRAGKKINLSKIVELSPKTASARFGLDLNLFCGGGRDLTKDETNKYIDEIMKSKDIDLVIETMGGKSDFVYNTCLSVVSNGKHFVTANKALLAERGSEIFKVAEQKGVKVGFEAAVCGAIPIIKTIKESFTGDLIQSVSGIMNGTSNYILTQMQDKSLEFDKALKLAQENGYAEANPSLDINGGDAGHKLLLMIKLAYGIEIPMNDLPIIGIEKITKAEIDFAREMDSKIKLICYSKKVDNQIFATVRPMMVKNTNFLSSVNEATNAVRLNNKYSGDHILVGKGAGSSETAMSIVSDIVFIARYGEKTEFIEKHGYKLANPGDIVFPFLITFYTDDVPGTTGLIATAIGNQNINIQTMGHNQRHEGSKAMFAVETMPCTLRQVENAISEIKTQGKGLLQSEPQILPIIY